MRKKLTELSRHELKSWLNLLSSDSDEGTIKLINIYFSYKQKLLKPNILRSFFKECVSFRAENKEKANLDFNSICYDKECYFGLCGLTPTLINGTSTFASTMNSVQFKSLVIKS